MESPFGAADTIVAANDERGGTWMRVASPSAGANWGAVFSPRIGTEVLVDFIEGDIDRLIVVGALYNGQDAPPFAAGVDQSGYNQRVMDNAIGERCRCSHRYRTNPRSCWIDAWQEAIPLARIFLSRRVDQRGLHERVSHALQGGSMAGD